MEVNTDQILFDSIKALGMAGIIEHPFQVSIIEYDRTKKTNKYFKTVYNEFSEPILLYHPSINFFGCNANFINAFKYFNELRYVKNQRCVHLYNLYKNEKNPITLYNVLFKELHKVYFHAPITKSLIQECIIKGTHTAYTSFGLSDIHHGQEERDTDQMEEWIYGVTLERILLKLEKDWYSNTFFYDNIIYDKIYCIACFTNMKNIDSISNILEQSVLNVHKINNFTNNPNTEYYEKMNQIYTNNYYNILTATKATDYSEKVHKMISTILKDIDSIIINNAFNEETFKKVLLFLKQCEKNPENIDKVILTYK
jgi:hypothetical protein